MLDLAKDTVVILGWAVNVSTLLIWASAIIGFAINIFANRKTAAAAYRDMRIREIAEAAFNHAEKIAAITPTSSDDKLLLYIKQSVKAFKLAFGDKPSEAEVAFLEGKAAELAEQDKLARMKAGAFSEEYIRSIAVIFSEEYVKANDTAYKETLDMQKKVDGAYIAYLESQIEAEKAILEELKTPRALGVSLNELATLSQEDAVALKSEISKIKAKTKKAVVAEKPEKVKKSKKAVSSDIKAAVKNAIKKPNK